MPEASRSSGIPDPVADTGALQAFVAVARSGTVSEAARRLGRTQPSISARLATLEAAWRTRLFRRAPRGMVLTPEGARLLPLAEASLAQLEELDRVAGRAGDEPRTLRVGAGDALGREVLPRALAQLLRRRPEVEVYLREGSGPRLMDALRDGEIDLALVVADAAPPRDIDVEPLARSEVVLLSPTGTEAGRRRVAIDTLAERPLVVLQRDSGFRRHLEAAFRERGLGFQPAIEVGNLSLVRRFVAAGLGSAPVPAIAFARDAMRGVARQPLTGIGPIDYVRAVRRGAPLPDVARQLLQRIRAAT